MSFYGTELNIDDSGLSMYGENAARLLRPGGSVPVRRLGRQLGKRLRVLAARSGELERLYEGGKTMPQAAQWLTDNIFLISGEGAKTMDELDLSCRLTAEKGLPAVFRLCLCLVRSGGGRITEDRCGLFFKGCQAVYVLCGKELDLLVPMLRTALIWELHELYAQGTLTDGAAVSAEALVSSLRLLSTLDMSGVLEDIDKVEQLYRRDPSGDYPLMSEESRAAYRRQTAKLARARGVSELRAAERAMLLSREASGEKRHVGYWLFAEPLGAEPKRRRGTGYICSVVLLTLFLSLGLAAVLDSLAAIPLLVLPMWEIVKTVTDSVLLRAAAPADIPRMELENGVPMEGRTICVISALLTSPQSGKRLAGRLEEYRLANRSAGNNLLFGILGDLPDADGAVCEKDAAILDGARFAVDALNAKYGGGFFLFVRDRAYNEKDGKYMAHERKRGAILGLAEKLCGRESALKVLSGSGLKLRGVRYILTLDEDTRLTPDSARDLIGAMLHPLNRPVTGRDNVVVRGHGIIHPRMSTELASVTKSGFSRIFAGQGGCDPYGCHCSELYMDVFGNGGFSGKGIIDAELFLQVMDGRIPDNAVLSHDALEGAFMRGGLMTDVELTDSFPSDILAYYKRMHRWVRGDWQNSPWLFKRGRALTPIDRFRLFDSLRRSLMPVACLVNFMLAFLIDSRAVRACAVTTLLAMGLRLVFALVSGLFRDGDTARRRFRSRIIRGGNAAFTRLLAELMLLPYEGWICASAAVTALWRMLVSGKNMLNWTPASAFDGVKKGTLKYFLTMWPALVIGLAPVVFSSFALGKAAGLLWIFSPGLAAALSREEVKHDVLSDEDKEWLLQKSAGIWGFFRDFCTPGDHFLPPDNYQERPPVGAAHRTSPTNIGLCLLSCLAALDLGIARRDEALGLAENILATLRRMVKWKGHLYNWYDTRTLKPLHPAYVSTVDCGNLAACLIILCEGLKELGEDGLAVQCAELLAPMSFAPFYDRRRRLFSIGVDTEKGKLSASYYDLMASEARTASFVAIAAGDVPRRHWRYLSRAQVSQKGLCGMVSWTGSMFEYLMPSLFLPSRPGSIVYETERFCADVQRRRTEGMGVPWGISESAYYSLDPALSYRYKAHGCGALALKKGMDEELVVSPYSSFLALCCRPREAVENLRRLEKEGAGCKYGFWEAVDHSPCRTVGKKGQVIPCVMAHHLGMSLVAADNRLRGNPMHMRLMKNPSMAAYACLLEERLPLDSPVIRLREEKQRETPPRSPSVFWERRGDHVDPGSPECCLLTNGGYRVLLSNLGVACPVWKGLMPYYAPKDAGTREHGIDLLLVKDGELINLLPSPEDGEDVKCTWEFNLYGAKISTRREKIRSQIVFAVSPDYNGEKRRISVDGIPGEMRRCRLLVGLTPVLAPYSDYINHPAFYALGMEARVINGTAVVRRLKRGSIPECYMCLAADVPLECSFRGVNVPGRGGLYAALEAGHPGSGGYLVYPRLWASLELNLQEGTDSAVNLVLAVGDTEEEAVSAAQRILAEPNGRGASFAADSAKAMCMEEKQVELAMELLRAVTFPAPNPSTAAKEQLWRLGISGDIPIICREIFSDESVETASDLIAAHGLLCAMGCPFDLVLVTDEGGDYLRPVSAALEKLRRESVSSSMVRITDRSNEPGAIFAWACHALERKVSRGPAFRLPPVPEAPRSGAPQWWYNGDGSFSFRVDHSLPPRAWGNMLTNGRFGFFATDCGTGHMWYGNAREYRINRWLCDSLAAIGTEMLTLNDRSAFASPEDTDCEVTFGFGFAKWEKSIDGCGVRLDAFVPFDADCRVLILSWDGGAADIRWYTDLVLGGGAVAGGPVSVTEDGEIIRAFNADCPFPDSPFYVCSNQKYDGLCTHRRDWLRRQDPVTAENADCLGLDFKAARSPLVLVCGCDERDKLLSLATPTAAGKALKDTVGQWKSKLSRLKIQTPLPSLDRLVNGWLPYQALACRLMGRCSIYQSGGAIGFRDQLQDSVNLILLDPQYAKKQILLSCRRQYPEGDVMHWWHELRDSAKGVRTHCSDDLLWLPWSLCEYTEKTGDMSLCTAMSPWLMSRPLEEGEKDRYEPAVLSDDTSPVIDHCVKAVELVMARGTGPHGLLKIGSGDWNDGMDKVGDGGDGESVWLSWFFAHTARRLSALLDRLGRGGPSMRLLKAAEDIGRKANEAWDGDWYLRGYFSDGTPLGSSETNFCRIDSIAQSFAALCPEADAERVKTALSSAVERLFKREDGLVLLFDPPFENSQPCPGYIESYGPGFRENGGQYTHAAVWLIMALLKRNRPDEAIELIEALIPEGKDTEVYQGEPYVLAADVYSNPACRGMAGWTWYTGAAGWFWRVIAEELLGLKLENGRIVPRPCLPEIWKDRELSAKLDGEEIL